MKWLHVSDIHYNPEKDGRSSKQLRNSLIKYLKDNNIYVDNVFVTGDFRNALVQKDENEYSVACASVKFVKEISESVGVINPENIHIIPGNHDLTRDKDSSKISEIRKAYNYEKGSFEQGDLEYLIERFHFFKCVEKLLHPDNKIWSESLLPIHQYKCFEMYNILYLNTAITCGSDDRNNLLIGNEALYDCLENIKEINPGKPIIILAHHSIDSFDKNEIKVIEQIFTDYPVKLYLCGDAHNVWRRTTNGIMEITMGCLKNDKDVQTVFSVGEMRENGEFSVEAHLWDSKFSNWAPYVHFNQDLRKWDLITPKKKHMHATIITNSIPFPATEHFIGRDEDIKKVEETIEARKPVVIYATPGMGKTEICRKLFEKYTKENSPFFKNIGWLFFRENIVNTFYNQFKFIEELDVEIYWIKIKKYISEHANDFLLIIDNVNDLSPRDLSDLISLGCVILLTSRGKIDRLTPIHLDKMSMEECRSLYRMHSKDQVSSDNTINQIIKLSDRHTLSIELLSKTQYASGKSSEDILESIINNGFNLADINEEISYTHNPEATLEENSENIFIEHMAKIFQIADISDPEELRILQHFSLLSPEPFPIGLAKECLDIKSLNIINKLVNKGWINRNDNQNSYNMHPVVSSVIRYCANPDYELVEPMMLWFADKLNIQPNEMYVQKLSFFPHALSIAKAFNTEVTDLLAILQNFIANMFKEQGNYTMALKWYKKALDIREKIMGKNHPLVAAIYSNIALVNIDQGNYTIALEWIQKAIAINEKLLGKENPSTATTYNNIALVYDHLGKYSEALGWYKKALAIDEKLLGQNHYSTATVYNNIATIYDNMGYYDEAIKYFKKALPVREKEFGKDHSDTGTTYNNLASVYDHKGDYPKAMELYQKALSINEKAFGKEHPTIATIYNNIALLYDSHGNYFKAMEWHKKALIIREKVLGIDHLDTATTYSNIGLAYDNHEDYINAIKWYKKALIFCEKEVNNQPFVGGVYNNIGAAYYGNEDYTKAMEWYQKALFIREKALGKNHPETATTYNNIGEVYYIDRDYAKAIKWYQKALSIREKVLGKDHHETAASYSGIAKVCFANRDYAKAIEWCQKALVIYENVFGKDHPNTKTVLKNMNIMSQQL